MIKVLSKSSYSRQVAIHAVRPSRSETTGTGTPHHASHGYGCSQQVENYSQSLSILRSHLSLDRSMQPSSSLLSIKNTNHVILASESSMSFELATKKQKMERNGTAVASKLHTFLSSASTFGHLLDLPQSPTMLCASC
ncbi:hypothetical protein KCU86_g82, partial [Aureobasidium melanogenum]